MRGQTDRLVYLDTNPDAPRWVLCVIHEETWREDETLPASTPTAPNDLDELLRRDGVELWLVRALGANKIYLQHVAGAEHESWWVHDLTGQFT